VKWRVFLAVLGLLSAAGLSRAQPGDNRARGDAAARRGEALRMVAAYVVSHLQESLGLSDAQYTKVLPLVTKLQADRREYVIRRGRVLREMRRLLKAGGASEAQIVEKLSELKRLEDDFPKRNKDEMEALDAALTPLQQAKYRLLELEVEQRVRELVNRVRGSRRLPQ